MIAFPERDFSAADEWVSNGRKLTETDLKLVQAVLENEGPVLVKHWFYGGSSGPKCIAFQSIEPLRDYLNTSASAGDAITIWSIEKLIENQRMNTVVSCKCANERGEVPRRGAY